MEISAWPEIWHHLECKGDQLKFWKRFIHGHDISTNHSVTDHNEELCKTQ